MSENNAIKFLEELNRNESLLSKVIDGCSSAATWVAAAASAGYDTTLDELRSTCEMLVGKPVSADSLVGELRSLFEGELNEEQLASAVGGASFALSLSRLNLIRLVGSHVQSSGPTWSNDPKRLDPGSLVINPGLLR